MLRIIAAIGTIQVFIILINMLRSKVVAVLLGPEGVGVISVVDQAVQVVARFTALSLPFAAVKFLSRSHSKDFGAFSDTYSSFLRALLLLTAAGSIIAIIIVIWFPDLLASETGQYQALLIPAFLAVPFITMHGYFLHVLAAAQKTRMALFVSLVIAISLACSAFLGISLGGVEGLYWANLAFSSLVAIGVLIYFERALKLSFFGRGHGIRDELRKNPGIVTFALILFGAAMTQSLAYFAARYSVLSGSGAAAAGLLQAAIGLSAALGLILTPANGLYLTPILNRAIPVREKVRASLEFERKLMVFMLILAMPMVLFAPLFLTLLYSPEFISVGSVLFLFVIAQGVLQLAGVHQALLIGLDDFRAYGIINIASQLLFGVVSWLLAPRYGILGVALGFLLSSIVLFSLTLFPLAQRRGLKMSPRIRFLLAYGMAALLLAGLLFNQFDDANFLVILGKVILYCLFVASLLLFLTKEELQDVADRGTAFLSRGEPTGWRRAVGYAYRRIIQAFSLKV